MNALYHTREVLALLGAYMRALSLYFSLLFKPREITKNKLGYPEYLSFLEIPLMVLLYIDTCTESASYEAEGSGKRAGVRIGIGIDVGVESGVRDERAGVVID
ncbi:hypothetical protein EON65_12660 [archaeon]|nr:MAG: hypothetical protein EON65_12660 [archaeon]